MWEEGRRRKEEEEGEGRRKGGRDGMNFAYSIILAHHQWIDSPSFLKIVLEWEGGGRRKGGGKVEEGSNAGRGGKRRRRRRRGGREDEVCLIQGRYQGEYDPKVSNYISGRYVPQKISEILFIYS
jgi:hypothetical protein